MRVSGTDAARVEGASVLLTGLPVGGGGGILAVLLLALFERAGGRAGDSSHPRVRTLGWSSPTTITSFYPTNAQLAAMGITLSEALADGITCAHHKVKAEGSDGHRQFRLTSNTVFCYDGEIITSWPNVWEEPEAWGSWSVVDSDSYRVGGGQESDDHRDKAWGEFRGQILGSTYTSTVHIYKWQEADGTGGHLRDLLPGGGDLRT